MAVMGALYSLDREKVMKGIPRHIAYAHQYAYAKTPAGRLSQKRYRESPKGQSKQKERNEKEKEKRRLARVARLAAKEARQKAELEEFEKLHEEFASKYEKWLSKTTAEEKEELFPYSQQS